MQKPSLTKQLKSALNKILAKYLNLSEIISSFVLKLLATNTARLFITYLVLYVPVQLLGIIHIYVFSAAFLILNLITLYLLLTTTKLNKLLKKIFEGSSFSSFKLWLYCVFYILYLPISWFGLVFTCMGWSGLIYFFAVPILLLFALYTIVVSILRTRSGNKIVRLNKTLIITLVLLQILLMIFNFRDGGDGPISAEMAFSSTIAMFVAPIYLITLTYFTLRTPFNSPKSGNG